jgi:hypothetical protein
VTRIIHGGRGRRRRPGRTGVLGAAALAVALGTIGGGPAAPSVAAATPSVTLVTSSTYDVLPAEHRVAVSVGITATSHLQDTVTRRYYVDRAYLVVLPGATNLHLTGPAGAPSVSVTARGAAGTTLLLRFGTQLGSGKTLALTLTFDLVDPGGPPDRALRISSSLVAFQAWAFGTDGVAGTTVRVRLPAGYEALVGRGPLGAPTTEEDGHVDLDSGPLTTPGTFVADIFADRPGDLVDSTQSTTVDGASVAILTRSWPDDPAWQKQVADLLVPGLPALASDIGVPWRLGPQLEVRETLVRPATTGTAGGGSPSAAFDPAATRLDVAYTADPTAILRGLAYAWFNGGLVADRWIAEGFAMVYAAHAGAALGVRVDPPSLTTANLAHAEPLNAWSPGGAADDYGYAASFAAASAIAAAAGPDAMRDVWAAAAAGIPAYQPGGWPPAVTSGDGGGATATGAAAAAAPETGADAPDWRSLLDLLEARTGQSFDTIWRTWIVRPADATLLDARAAARRLYDATVQQAGDWVLPRSIRDAMRAWRFDTATEELTAAASVLRQRADLEAAAAAAGLTLPPTLRAAFEGDGGIGAASAEAVTELAVSGVIARAEAAQPRDPDIITRLGLLGTTPDQDLASARSAFAAGDLDGAVRAADAATSIWTAALGVARGRIVGALLLGLAITLLARLVFGPRRPRRQHAHKVR